MIKSFQEHARLLFIFSLIVLPVNSLFSAGNQESRNKNKIITYESSSSGTIYRIDYTPPKTIDKATVHYIQIKIYDSLGKSFNKIYYLKSSDKKSKRNTFNLIFPSDYFIPNAPLTVSIDYYSENAIPLGSVSEQFKPIFQLVFESIAQDEAGIGPYRKSNRLLTDIIDEVDLKPSHTDNTYVELFKEYFGNIPKEIQEFISDDSDVYFLVKMDVYLDQNHDINSINQSVIEHNKLIDKFTAALKKYIDDYFPYKLSFPQSAESYNIKSLIHYEFPDSSGEYRWSPYIQIYLFKNIDDSSFIQKTSFGITRSTLNTLLDKHIVENMSETDSKVVELKNELLSLIDRNKQTSKEFLDKNSRYLSILSQFNTILGDEQYRLKNWIDSRKTVADEAIEKTKISKDRISDIQERINSIKQEIARSTEGEIVIASKQKELDFLSSEAMQLNAMVIEYDREFNSVLSDMNERVEKFNSANTQFTLLNENPEDVIGRYSLVYNNAEAIRPEKTNEINRLDIVLEAIAQISMKEQEGITLNLSYLPDRQNQLSLNLEDMIDQIEKFMNDAQENYDASVDEVVKQINDIQDSNEFKSIVEIIQSMNSSLHFEGIASANASSSSLVEALENLLSINQYLSNAVYKYNSEVTNEPLLKDVYDAIQSLPSTAILTEHVDRLIGNIFPASGINQRIISAVPPLDADSLATDSIHTIEEGNQSLGYNANASTDIERAINHIIMINPYVNEDEIREILNIYFSESLSENTNPLVPIAQMLYHTKYFKSKEITETTFNFGFIGSDNAESKWASASFPTPTLGIRAHIQHIKAYSTTDPIKSEIVDPRYPILVREGLVGTKNTLREMLGSWYPPENSEKIYAEIIAILEQLKR